MKNKINVNYISIFNWIQQNTSFIVDCNKKLSNEEAKKEIEKFYNWKNDLATLISVEIVK